MSRGQPAGNEGGAGAPDVGRDGGKEFAGQRDQHAVAQVVRAGRSAAATASPGSVCNPVSSHRNAVNSRGATG